MAAAVLFSPISLLPHYFPHDSASASCLRTSPMRTSKKSRLSVAASLPQPRKDTTHSESPDPPAILERKNAEEEMVTEAIEGVASAISEAMPSRVLVVVAACVVGLLTGLGVVIFNNAVHELRDSFWDGIPSRGASWLREEPIENVWQRVILVPVCGGVIVGIINSIRSSLRAQKDGSLLFNIKSTLEPFLKAVAASFTLGTGNSLGPEGPSVEIGSAIAKGISHLFKWTSGKKISLVASGSAAGISSGVPEIVEDGGNHVILNSLIKFFFG